MKSLRLLLFMVVCGWTAFLFAGEPEVVLYKSPTCGCCEGYAAYLRQHGFKVTEQATNDMDAVKKRLGVPEALQSCHTAVIDGYVVEGHVPQEAIKRLLVEHPKITGIASPGMPSGSPGMPGPHEPNRLQTFSPQGSQVFGEY